MNDQVWTIRLRGHDELPVITTITARGGYPSERELLSLLHEHAQSSRLTRSVFAEVLDDDSWLIIDADNEQSVGVFHVVGGLE